ncbi:CH082 protein, partial [Rhinopomastus cyanomelas]|nr:CH082 protein [Rhinopomastus cyanomelas]
SLALRLLPGTRAATGPSLNPGSGPIYQQGQRPEPRTREYFYCIDHHGRLYLDDTKVKNFITCFKDTSFLTFFFTHLEPNRSGRYETHFPFLSRCGRERNFLRCEDQPIVFTDFLPATDDGHHGFLSYCGAGHSLTVPFEPQQLIMSPDNGRLYHPAPARGGGIGLVRSALALEWSPCFEYGHGPTRPPTHFNWEGQRYQLTQELLPLLRSDR